MAHVSRGTLPIAALIIVTAAAAWGATVYRWTDENGTVHFGDTPPPHGAQVKTQTLPNPALAAPEADAKPDEGKSGDEDPARIVLTDQQSVALAPSVESFRGKVKNAGGTEASGVSIGIVVTDRTQGDECLRGQIDVEPSTLAPGAEGTFEGQFDNPCFQGPTEAALRAQWH